MGGIYKISCAANRHLFVGSCKDFNTRWAEHRQLLSRNKHFCQPLQQAWNRFGERQFAFSIIEQIGDEDTSYFLAREASYIRSFVGKGISMFSTRAMGPSSRVFSQDRISAKISTTLQYKAMSMSREERAALWGKGRRGRCLSKDHKRKMSEELSGQRRSVEVRRNMSIGQKESFASSEERKLKSAEVGRKNKGRIPANATVYEVDGVEYPSGSSAMKALGITSQELFKMVRFGRARKKSRFREYEEVVVMKETPRVQVGVHHQDPVYRVEPQDPSCEEGFGFYI